MRIKDIESLEKRNGLYDLYKNTFTFNYISNIPIGYYIVPDEEEMRIDMVCYSIYNSVDYIDVILNINNIDNPLNIKKGTILIYPKDKQDLLISDDIIIDINNLVQKDKSTRVDIDRTKYINNKSLLPPTVLENRTEQYNIDGDKIIIGTNLF